MKQGTPQQLIADMQHNVFEALVTADEQHRYEMSDHKIANIMFTAGKTCLRVVSDLKPDIGEVVEARPNLEDVYLYLVG